MGDAAWIGDDQKWTFIRSNSTVAEADDDGDGMNNHAEFTAGTDASDSNSVFSIISAAPSTHGMVMNWDSVIGRVYSIDWAYDLTEGFTNIQDLLAYPVNSCTDTVERLEQENFYRIRVSLP